MDSRTRENPERTFDLVLNVKCHASEDEDPVVLWKFPEDFGDQEVLQSVPKFCFPFDVERVSQNQVGQHFTFVLTDIESKQRFGFCRLTSGGRICLCILRSELENLHTMLYTYSLHSWMILFYLPWFEVYYKLLNTLADYLAKEQENDLNVTLRALYNHPVPKANSPVNLSVRNLTEYFVAVDANNMLQLYASMLHERRIIVTCSKLSTLTACLHGSAALLFPMYWQHIYIPVLPPHLLDYCCAPMPYLIGIHSSLIERVKNKSLEDVVMLNVDTNTLESPFNDLINLPSDVVSALKNKLKKQSTATGDGVARAFLRAQAALFGSYRDALRYKPGEPITFCEESFVKHRSSPMKQFLETAVNLQLFKQFIDGRLAKLNSGRGFSDVFEEEITSGGFCGGSPRSYQQWVHTVKKGGALFNSAMTRATPAVRTAYKFAKSHAKQGIREVKSKLKHKESEDGYGTCSSCVQYTPVYTLHSERGANPEKRRLSQARLKGPRKSLDGPAYDDEDDDVDRASKLSSEDGEEAPVEFYESDDSADTGARTACSGEMDLLGEILDTLSTHSSDQGKLAAAKSLDFFRSMDNIDYKATNKSNAPSENSLALLDGGSGDQTEWHRGQDDSALHGKHLPPSPRKRVSSGGVTESLLILREESRDTPPCAAPEGRPVAAGQAAPAAEPDSPRSSPAASRTCDGNPGDTETLRQTSEDPLAPGLGRRPSTSVPWEREGRDAEEPAEGVGLLREVVSLCRMSSPFGQDVAVPEEDTGGNQA